MRSVLRQSPCPGDVRVYLGVDGPVPPAIEEVIAEFAGSIRRTLRNATNIGLSKTLNRLIDLIGDEDYVVRVDADDVSAPNRLYRQIAALEDDPALDLVGCQAHDIDAAGRIVGERDYPLDHDTIVRAMRFLNPVVHPGWTMRRRVIRELGLRYRDPFLTEDLDFLMQLVEAGGRVGNVRDRVLYVRVYDDFFTRRVSLRRGLTELRLYGRWTLRQDGVVSAAWPAVVARFLLRIVPGWVAEALYSSSLRSRIVGRPLAVAGHGIGGGHDRGGQDRDGGNLYRKIDQTVKSD
jgi:glycosyltransferase involved in cell wall biosynthesis